MKVQKPYEILIRFALDGTVAGAHYKKQSYYTDDAGNPDLATWREEQPQPADLQDPAVSGLLTQCGADITARMQTAEQAAAEAQAAADALAQQNVELQAALAAATAPQDTPEGQAAP